MGFRLQVLLFVLPPFWEVRWVVVLFGGFDGVGGWVVDGVRGLAHGRGGIVSFAMYSGDLHWSRRSTVCGFLVAMHLAGRGFVACVRPLG